MSNFTDSAQSKQIDQREHNNDASAKRTVLRAQDPVSGAWVNIAAKDNGDGTYSLSAFSKSVVRANKVHQVTTITTSTAETTVLSAAASTYHDVYGVIVTNTSSTATEVAFKDDTGGTTRFTISAPANDTRGFMLSPDAAFTASAVNDNWTATCADSVSSILITVIAAKNT